MNSVRSLLLLLILATSFARAEDRPLLKAGYLPVSARVGIVKKMREAGLNAAWPKVTSFSPSGEDERVRLRLESWSDACAANEMELWPVINFAGSANELEHFADFRREVLPSGLTMPHTPCPVDEDYWRKVIFSRCVTLARWSLTRPALRGVVLDLEMYGADHAGYTSACACEACRRGAGSSQPDALLAWQRREVERIARELERAVHRVNARFQFAAMHLEEPFPFHEGLAAGLGTAEMPVVAAAERTYAAGYTPEVDQTRERFRQQKLPVRYLGGLSLTHHRAAQIAPQLYALGSHGDGFWLYTLGSLALPNEQVAEGYRLADPQTDYWSAFRSASDELDRFVTSRGQHVSPLAAKLEPTKPFATLTKRMLEPISPKSISLPLAGDETRLRRNNVTFVVLKEGETLRLSVLGVRISRQNADDGGINVIDPDGREVLQRKVPLGKTESIELTAKSAGTYWVVTTFGLNACELRIANSHVAHFAGLHQRLKVHQRVRPMHFAVPDERPAQFNVLLEGPEDSVRLRVRDALGKVTLDEVVSGSVTRKLSGSPGVWSFSLEPLPDRPLGGVQIGLSPPLAPYLADAPERLLRDKQP